MTDVAGKDGIIVTFVLDLKPDAAEQMREGFAAALPDTRNFPGCRSVHVYEDIATTNRLILIENWDSRDAYERYLAWRAESGMLDAMANALERPSTPDYWTFLA